MWSTWLRASTLSHLILCPTLGGGRSLRLTVEESGTQGARSDPAQYSRNQDLSIAVSLGQWLSPAQRHGEVVVLFHNDTSSCRLVTKNQGRRRAGPSFTIIVWEVRGPTWTPTRLLVYMCTVSLHGHNLNYKKFPSFNLKH